MKSEKRTLILDLMDEERSERREATLLAGSRILRRKRWGRVAMPGFAMMAVLGLAVFSLQRSTTPTTSAPAPATRQLAIAIAVPPASAAPDAPQAVTDEELLAMFPDTPVALAQLENGKKRLIFPRAGDEERFLTRM